MTATMMAAKTVLITGASRGLGLQFAEHYVHAGWKVIATARNVDAADTLKQLAPWKIVQLDASDESSILRAAQALDGVAIDLLLNNAGILTSFGVATSTKADIMQQFEVNAVGPFLTTRAFVPNLRIAVQNRGEAVVAQISSRMGSIALNEAGGYVGYRASKAALNMVSASLAKDLASDKIAIVMLHPGYVSTEMSDGKGDLTPPQSVAALTSILDNISLGDSGKFLHYEGFALQW